MCSPSRLPWVCGTVCTFFACTKKVPKKYTEGLRALLTPGDAVKFLRFDGDTGNFAVSSDAKMRGFYLLLSNCGLTQAVFLRNFWGYIIMGFGLPPEFSCLNLWHENGHVFAEDNFVIFDCSPASIAGGLTALFSLVRKKFQKSTQRACEPSPLPGTP